MGDHLLVIPSPIEDLRCMSVHQYLLSILKHTYKTITIISYHSCTLFYPNILDYPCKCIQYFQILLDDFDMSIDE